VYKYILARAYAIHNVASPTSYHSTATMPRNQSRVNFFGLSAFFLPVGVDTLVTLAYVGVIGNYFRLEDTP